MFRLASLSLFGAAFPISASMRRYGRGTGFRPRFRHHRDRRPRRSRAAGRPGRGPPVRSPGLHRTDRTRPVRAVRGTGHARHGDHGPAGRRRRPRQQDGRPQPRAGSGRALRDDRQSAGRQALGPYDLPLRTPPPVADRRGDRRVPRTVADRLRTVDPGDPGGLDHHPDRVQRLARHPPGDRPRPGAARPARQGLGRPRGGPHPVGRGQPDARLADTPRSPPRSSPSSSSTTCATRPARPSAASSPTGPGPASPSSWAAAWS
jgi:hypothetical protein